MTFTGANYEPFDPYKHFGAWTKNKVVIMKRDKFYFAIDD